MKKTEAFFSKNTSLVQSKSEEKEFVKQSNEISRSFYTCSLTARRLIALATSHISKGEKKLSFSKTGKKIESWFATFSISEFCKTFDLTDSGMNYNIIKEAVIECQTAKIILQHENGSFESFVWFCKAKFNSETNMIELTFTPDVGDALYNMKLGYTAMTFKTLSHFKSLYTFRFYEIAVSYRGNEGINGNKKGQWWFEYDIPTLKKTFAIDENAYAGRINNFIQWVVQKPIDELNKVNREFKIEIEKLKSGRKIIGLRFICTAYAPITEKTKINKSDTPLEKKEKIEIQKEHEFFERHSEELKILSEEMKYSEERGCNTAEFAAMLKLTKIYPNEWKETKF